MSKRSRPKSPFKSRRGMALLIVVVLVMLISLGAYRFSFYMESQYRLTRVSEEQVHARLAALSGLELAVTMVEMPAAQQNALGGIHNNVTLFQHVSIEPTRNTGLRSDEETVWRFCLVSPCDGDDISRNSRSSTDLLGGPPLPVRFGLENESAKLHIPTVLAWDRLKPGHARQTLLGLPGMDEAMVDAWLRELGASVPIDRVGTPSQSANLDDIKYAWFGGDLNQNYQLDPLEARMMHRRQSQNKNIAKDPIESSSSSSAFRPLQRYLTWYSGHRNITRNGQPRINLNDPDLRSLHRKLSMIWSSDWANFVIAMRQLGPSNPLGNSTLNLPGGASGAGGLNLPGGAGPGLSAGIGANATTANTTAANAAATIVSDWVPDFGKSSVYTFRSPLDLVGAVVELPATVGATGPANRATLVKQMLRNPFSSDLASIRNYLGKVLDDVTVDLAPVLEGRIDVTDAPVEVLAGIPGLDLGLAQRIAEKRMVQQRGQTISTSTTTSERDTVAWLLDVVDLAKLKELEPYLTCRSDVYSVQAIGYRDNQSAVYRMTATIDARQNPPQLRNQKVWHPWDRGFSIDQLSNSKL